MRWRKYQYQKLTAFYLLFVREVRPSITLVPSVRRSKWLVPVLIFLACFVLVLSSWSCSSQCSPPFSSSSSSSSSPSSWCVPLMVRVRFILAFYTKPKRGQFCPHPPDPVSETPPHLYSNGSKAFNIILEVPLPFSEI
eukprot:517535-Hanusia_phi.AAC.4